MTAFVGKPDLGGGISHPARFSAALLPVMAGFLEPGWKVLDPFAGPGGVHALRDLLDVETVGLEIEPEWAAMHPATVVGDALDPPFAPHSFDAIVTSPCFGNRLADHHDARDGSVRRSYRHDLGRPLHPNNSGALQWGPRYRAFHEAAWARAVELIRPGGRFILNVKDHRRRGARQPVSAWHARTLLALRLELVDCVPVPLRGLRHGANGDARESAELVWVFSVGGIPGGSGAAT